MSLGYVKKPSRVRNPRFQNMNEENEEVLLHKKMIEALAYTLFENFSVTMNGESGPAGEQWQNTAGLRAAWRAHALRIVGSLSERGLKVVIGTQRKLESAVSALAVVPARMAYTLDEDSTSVP